MQTPFVQAPFVHPFRAPSYYTQLLRALQLAKKERQKVYWIAAYDKVASKEADSETKVTEERKAYFLQLHDGKRVKPLAYFIAQRIYQ